MLLSDQNRNHADSRAVNQPKREDVLDSRITPGRNREDRSAVSGLAGMEAGAAARAPKAAGRRRRKRKPMTAAQKAAVGDRMKKYWAARRKAAAKG